MLVDKNLELLVEQLRLRPEHLRSFPLLVEREETQEMVLQAAQVLMVDTEDPPGAAQVVMKMPGMEDPLLQTFLMMNLLGNKHLVVAAELDTEEAQMEQAERPTAELAVQENMETAKMANSPVAVAVLDQIDGLAVPVPMAAFTCGSIGNEG